MPRPSVREYRDRYLPRSVRVWVSRSVHVLLWSTRQGHVYYGRILPFQESGADAQRSEVWSHVHEGVMKRKDRAECPGLALHASPNGLTESYPNLAEFMTAAAFEGDSERREAPTLTVWASGGQWKASVKDRAEGLVMWLSADSWKELWQMIDLFCMESSAPWRHDDPGHDRNGKRVRK